MLKTFINSSGFMHKDFIFHHLHSNQKTKLIVRTANLIINEKHLCLLLIRKG